MASAQGPGRVADWSTRGVVKRQVTQPSNGVIAEYLFYDGMIVVGVDAQETVRHHHVSAGTYKQDEPLFIGAAPGQYQVIRPQRQVPIAFVIAWNSEQFLGLSIIQDFVAS